MKASKRTILKRIVIIIFFIVQYPLNNYSKSGNFISDAGNCIAGGRIDFASLGHASCWPLCNDSAERIVVYLYANDISCFPQSVLIKVWSNDDNSLHFQIQQQIAEITNVIESDISCIADTTNRVNLKRAWYGANVNLSPNITGYTAAVQGCCRMNDYANIIDNTGWSYSCKIPPISIYTHSPIFFL